MIYQFCFILPGIVYILFSEGKNHVDKRKHHKILFYAPSLCMCYHITEFVCCARETAAYMELILHFICFIILSWRAVAKKVHIKEEACTSLACRQRHRHICTHYFILVCSLAIVHSLHIYLY